MLTRYGSFTQITEVVKDPSKLTSAWSDVVHSSYNANKPMFAGPKKFSYDLENFLYYRARAITADITNLNGDRFPHPEIRKAYTTFIGKGVYFNHNSQDPDNAFGIILDAAYTPVFFDKEDYADKYVELLGAIHRKSCEEKYPGLLKDIESGKISSTSMGVMARKAVCSICGNVAISPATLCEHVNPISPMYCKGREVYGRLCYEDNYDLTYLEDSVVYVPADATAKIFEIYASKKQNTHVDNLSVLRSHFSKYATATGRQILQEPLTIYSEVNMPESKNEAPKATPENTPVPPAPITPAPAAATEAPKETPETKKLAEFKASLADLHSTIREEIYKYLNSSASRVIDEEVRKVAGPMKDAIEKHIRQSIAPELKKLTEDVKAQVATVMPDIMGAVEDVGPVGEKVEEPAKEEGVKSESSVIITEDFGSWAPEARVNLIDAIKKGASFNFTASLEPASVSIEFKDIPSDKLAKLEGKLKAKYPNLEMSTKLQDGTGTISYKVLAADVDEATLKSDVQKVIAELDLKGKSIKVSK